MKKAAIAFAAAVAIVAILITGYAIACGSAEPVAIGQLWMLALTLIVLVWYAYDTNSIATVTRQRWLREAVLSTSYEVALIRKAGGGRSHFVQDLQLIELGRPGKREL